MSRKCPKCGVNSSRSKIQNTEGGCMRGETVSEGAPMCAGMRLILTEMALRRAVCPSAFDNNGRIKDGQLGFAIDAQNKAVECQKRIFGPTLVEVTND